ASVWTRSICRDLRKCGATATSAELRESRLRVVTTARGSHHPPWLRATTEPGTIVRGGPPAEPEAESSGRHARLKNAVRGGNPGRADQRRWAPGPAGPGWRPSAPRGALCRRSRRPGLAPEDPVREPGPAQVSLLRVALPGQQRNCVRASLPS